MSAPLPDWCMPIFPIADAYHEHLGRQSKENLMATVAAIDPWLIDTERREQANKEAEFATRIIEALASQMRCPRESDLYNTAIATMTMYLTKSVEVKK
jgi:seryl-tRNA(Sec) selenium transferase